MGTSGRVELSTREGSWFQRICEFARSNAHMTVPDRSDDLPLPSFFVIGPPRTGTTWLHEVLRHRAVLPTPTKETRFFDSHFHRGLKWYRAHFPRPHAGRPVGEIAPTYFASNMARERIACLLPNARVICAFRDPVQRVLSLYRLKSAYGMIRWNFEQALLHDPELLDSGKYATNLKEWWRILGRDQVLATLYDDLRRHPQGYIDQVADFIGVPRFALSPAETRFVNSSESMTYPRNYSRTRSATLAADWFKARRMDNLVARIKKSKIQKFLLGGGPPFAELSDEMSRQLYQVFRPEVEELECLLNRDLSAWKTAQG